jgi:hypothetical protein
MRLCETPLKVQKLGIYFSKGGLFVQVSPMGFSAPIIVWDYDNRKLLHKLILHKVTTFFILSNLLKNIIYVFHNISKQLHEGFFPKKEAIKKILVIYNCIA